MKIVLTGMYSHQLTGLADELSAEFPEHRIEVVDGRESPQRAARMCRSADLVVATRFWSHKHVFAVRGASADLRLVDAKSTMADYVRVWLGKRQQEQGKAHGPKRDAA